LIIEYQAMLGVPVPDATQWDHIEKVGDCAYGVFAQMEQVAAQGELIFHDDTAVRILSLMQENRDRLAAAQAQGLSVSFRSACLTALRVLQGVPQRGTAPRSCSSFHETF